jgi:hypothetical protein
MIVSSDPHGTPICEILKISKFSLNAWFLSFTTLYFIQNTRVTKKNSSLMNIIKGKKENVSLHTKHAYRGSGGVAPSILKLTTRWRSVVNFTAWPSCHRERNPVPTEQEALRAPGPVWALTNIIFFFNLTLHISPAPHNPVTGPV